MLYIRGILVHGGVWLVSCALHPFFWAGFSRDTAMGLLVSPFVFGLGLPLLCVGSAIWMLLFLIPRLRHYGGVGYHIWVAIGGSVAVLFAAELGSLGDPRPTFQQYFAPAIVAFPVGLVFSAISEAWLRYVPGLTKRWSEQPPAARSPLP